MGLDVSAGLLYGILVRREELVMAGPEIKQCRRSRHRYDLAVDFRYCPQCSSELVVETMLVPLPKICVLWPDLMGDHPTNWRGERDSTWGESPGGVSFYDASQTHGSGEDRDVPKVLLLGVSLTKSSSHRSGEPSDVCSMNEFALEVWRPRIRQVANKAEWGGRPLELVVVSYLSY